ncbi:hypothetical protein HK104_006727 [Borealophlyctis nickersoniae]|nr:hypothetical protein HK104_006727 [Borealophlyctis nickersoniae]
MQQIATPTTFEYPVPPPLGPPQLPIASAANFDNDDPAILPENGNPIFKGNSWADDILHAATLLELVRSGKLYFPLPSNTPGAGGDHQHPRQQMATGDRGRVDVGEEGHSSNSDGSDDEDDQEEDEEMVSTEEEDQDEDDGKQEEDDRKDHIDRVRNVPFATQHRYHHLPAHKYDNDQIKRNFHTSSSFSPPLSDSQHSDEPETYPAPLMRPFRKTRMKRLLALESEDEVDDGSDDWYRASKKRKISPKSKPKRASNKKPKTMPAATTATSTTRKSKSALVRDGVEGEAARTSGAGGKRGGGGGAKAAAGKDRSSPDSIHSNSSSSAAPSSSSSSPRSKRSPNSKTTARRCSYCSATSTPMWRHGPSGYADLCNKCGVKWMRGRILQDVDSSRSE